MNTIIKTDVCSTGYDYEQYQLNELENENMKLRRKLEIATRALKKYESSAGYGREAFLALKEMEALK